ncbi:MAG: methionine adenosyltransferase domain-containing protein [Candidatus Uhrbacteria bacterium]
MKAVEALAAGQPDKICDQIADGIVDEYLRRDPESRLDIKVLGSHGMIMIGGEVNSTADFDVAALVKQIYQEIGYQDEVEVFVNVEPSSEEMKTTRGSYDTVIVNGYATRETREFLPLPLVLAQGMVRRLDDLRRLDPAFYWLGPDGKVQIVMNGKKVSAVTLLASHAADVSLIDLQTKLLERVIEPVVGHDGAQIFINPIGSFISSGFQADAGASGRRPNADFYGGLIPHGDASPIGKDPFRAERAGAYMARYVAKQLVAQGLAESAMVSLVYTLGRLEPIMIEVKAVAEKSRGAKMDFTNLVKEKYNFNLASIVEQFDLKKPRYRAVSVYGHFGREGLPWEEAGGNV